MTDSGQNHEFAVTLALQGPNGLLTAASLKECKALAAVVSASQTGPPNFPSCGKGGEQWEFGSIPRPLSSNPWRLVLRPVPSGGLDRARS